MASDIFTLAKQLGARSITDSSLANSPLGRNYLNQRGYSQSAEEQLQETKTPLGALSSGIALYIQRKRENEALNELNKQVEAENQARASKRQAIIGLLPEDKRPIADILEKDDDLAKYASQVLAPPSEEDKLSLENKRLQNQKLKKEIYQSNQASRSEQPVGNYSPKVANAIDTDLLKKSNEAASIAENSLSKLGQLDQILSRNKTGKVASKLQAAGQYIPLVNSDDYQSAEQITNDLGLETSTLLKGQTSDKDVQRSILANPSFEYEKGANDIIIKNKTAFLQTLKDKADFDNDWVSRYGSTLAKNEKGISHKKAWSDAQKQLFTGYGGQIIKEGQKPSELGKIDKKQALKDKYGLN